MAVHNMLSAQALAAFHRLEPNVLLARKIDACKTCNNAGHASSIDFYRMGYVFIHFISLHCTC